MYRDCAVVFKPESSWSTIIDHQHQETRTKFCPPELSIWDLPDLQKVSSWIVSIYRFYVLLPAHRIAARDRDQSEERCRGVCLLRMDVMDTCSEGDGGRDLDLGDAETEDVLSSPPPGPVTMASVPMMVDQPQSPLSPGPVTMLANTTLDLSSFLDTSNTQKREPSQKWVALHLSVWSDHSKLSALRFLTNMQFCLLFIRSRQCSLMRCCHCNANGLKNVAAFFDLNIYNCVPGIWKSVKYVWITSPRGPSKIRSSLWRNSWSRCSTTSTAPSMHFSNPCSRGTSSPYFPKRWNIAAATSTCVARYWYALLRFQRDT